MNRVEYLDWLARRVESTLADPGFDNQRSQIRSKDLLVQLSPSEAEGIGYTYSSERLTRNALFAFESAWRMVGAGRDLSEFSELFRRSAEVFEHLHRLREGPLPEASAILSAALYQVAGYQANATCLARSITPEPLPDPSVPFKSSGVRRWMQLSLQGQFVRVLQEAISVREGLTVSQDRLIALIDEAGPHADAVVGLAELAITADAFSNLAAFALRGDDERLGQAVSSLEDATDLLSKTGQAMDALTVRAASILAAQLSNNSTWHLLANYIRNDALWHRYAMLLARGNAPNQLDARGVVQLWPSQRIALREGLLEENRGFVVRMPTSAGKTRIAELAIMNVLSRTDQHSRVVYVAPFRALSDEVERSLADIFADLGFRVSSMLGSFELDDFQDYVLHETDLLITTPEKLNLLSRARPEFFDSVELLILDEGHIIDDIDRGAKYELLLSRLRAKMPPTGRMLFISAVLPEANAEEFAEWLCGRKEAVISTEWRPARQALGLFRWSTDTGQIDYPLEAAVVRARPPFVPRVVRITPYTDYTPKLRRQKISLFPSKQKNETAAELAIRFAELGPVLIFTTKPDWAESCAKAVQRGILLRRQTEGAEIPQPFERARNAAATTASMEATQAWLGERSTLASLLADGIAVHHRGLPESVRRAIEGDFRQGSFPILVATNTLGQGVNLPIKTVIVHSVARYRQGEDGEDGESIPLNQREFWNVCGRAGRAGAETEGQVIFISTSEEDDEKFDLYAEKDYEPIRGRLYEILGQIVANRLSQEEFARQLDSELLAVMIEETVGTDAGQRLEQLLNASLVKIQADRTHQTIAPLIDLGSRTVADLTERIADEAGRKVFALTGLRVSSCEALAADIRLRPNVVRELLTDPGVQQDELIKEIYRAVESLPQMTPQYAYECDYQGLLLDWVRQTPVEDLTAQYAATDAEAQRLHRFIEDYFGFRLPWGLNGYLRIAKYVLQIEDDLPELQRFLPSMVKFGVNHPYATWPMSLGCTDRALATVIAQAFLADSPSQARSFKDFIDWFSILTEEDFVYRFSATSHQARVLTLRSKSVVPEREGFANLVRDRAGRLSARLVGTQYDGREAHALGIEAEDSVELRRDYLNPYDRNAIAVFHHRNQVGFVERGVARLIAPEIDAGLRHVASVEYVQREPSLRVRLAVAAAV